jgi:uncharacterized Zn finger protein
MDGDYFGWAPYVSVAERRRKAEKAMEKQRKKGLPVSPVVIQGRTIARTFWGRAWCDNLERYSDFSNRLPRGRTYVRNGSVVDLQIAPGLVWAQVSGSSLYRVRVEVKAAGASQWQALCRDCGGAVATLVELLQGRFSEAVMERICSQEGGLFPSPREIAFACSCPDGAVMCKHVAAVLYGIGARLDAEPELLFLLRHVDGNDLLAQAAAGLAPAQPAADPGRVLEGEDLADLFGLDMGTEPPPIKPAPAVAKPKVPAKPKAPAKAKVPAKSSTPRKPEPAPVKPPRGKITKGRKPAAVPTPPKPPAQAPDTTRPAKRAKPHPKARTRSGVIR